MTRIRLAPAMAVLLGLALAAIAVPPPASAQNASTPAPPSGRIVITDVTIVDPSGARDFPRPMTVVIDAGHIVGGGPTPPASARRGAQVIDGRGRFLIPGLWDMHVHVTDAGEQVLGAAAPPGAPG